MEDLDVYLVAWGIPADLNGNTIQVIFSDYHDDLFAGMAEGRSIFAKAKTEDILSASKGDLVVIEEKNYTIVDFERGRPNGEFTKLILEEA
jgi:hypothetical protein